MILNLKTGNTNLKLSILFFILSVSSIFLIYTNVNQMYKNPYKEEITFSGEIINKFYVDDKYYLQSSSQQTQVEKNVFDNNKIGDELVLKKLVSTEGYYTGITFILFILTVCFVVGFICNLVICF